MKILEGVHGIDAEPSPGTISRQYLILGDKLALIDSGISSSGKKILSYIESIGYDAKDLSFVINTHGHIDHFSGNAEIKNASNAKILAHKLDVPWIEDVHKYFDEVYTSYKQYIPDWEGVKSWFDSRIAQKHTKVDRYAEDGGVLDLGDGVKLKILHTPGHTRGSVSIYDSGHHALMIGCCVQGFKGLGIYVDVDAELRTLKRLHGLEDVKYQLSAHTTPHTLGWSEAQDYMGKSIEGINRMHELVRESLSAELSKEFFNYHRPYNIREITTIVSCKLGIERAMLVHYDKNPVRFSTIQAHLDKLVADNEARKIEKNGQVLWVSK